MYNDEIEYIEIDDMLFGYHCYDGELVEPDSEGIFIGVEIESKTVDIQDLLTAHEAGVLSLADRYDEGTPQWLATADSTVAVEYISQPLRPGWLKDEIGYLYDFVEITHTGHGGGFHLHISGVDHEILAICLILLKDELVKISRRSKQAVNDWCKLPDDSELESVGAMLSWFYNTDRYKMVRDTGKTLEFRLFSSVRSKSEALMKLELIERIVSVAWRIEKDFGGVPPLKIVKEALQEAKIYKAIDEIERL